MAVTTTTTNQHLSTSSLSFSFSDFPEDVQLSILSFLSPPEIAAFASTSKRFVSLCRNDAKLWFSVCDRRWGSKTQIIKWANGKITYKQLYQTLNEFDNLIGFWRPSRCSSSSSSTAGVSSSMPPPPPLVFFEWGPFFITGSRVSPSKNGSYDVIKEPFLWLGIAPNGEPFKFLDPQCRFGLSEELFNSNEFSCLENDLIPVNVSFMGQFHVVIEEILSLAYSNSPEGKWNGHQRVPSSGNLRAEEEFGVVEDLSGSPPDRIMSEMYQYFANRISPGGERGSRSRRQRKREKERHGRRKWEPELLVKIVNCSPTPSRPLQGLWKGICNDMLDFYLVVYDDIGGIACRRVGDSSKPFSSYAPVFWTSSATFIESPFPPEEDYIYDSRVRIRPPGETLDNGVDSHCTDVVLRMLYINSSYDLVIPELAGTAATPQQVEGRIWQYRDGTFGFGFLRNNFIIDLKHIAQNNCLLDTTS